MMINLHMVNNYRSRSGWRQITRDHIRLVMKVTNGASIWCMSGDEAVHRELQCIFASTLRKIAPEVYKNCKSPQKSHLVVEYVQERHADLVKKACVLWMLDHKDDRPEPPSTGIDGGYTYSSHMSDAMRMAISGGV